MSMQEGEVTASESELGMLIRGMATSEGLRGGARLARLFICRLGAFAERQIAACNLFSAYFSPVRARSALLGGPVRSATFGGASRGAGARLNRKDSAQRQGFCGRRALPTRLASGVASALVAAAELQAWCLGGVWAA